MANSYLSRTPSSAGNRKTWTWSGWIKTATTSGDKGIFTASTDASNRNAINLSNEGYFIFDYEVGGVRNVLSSQNTIYRDVSGWYHLVVAVDTTQATDSNRVKMYVNGSQITLTGVVNNYPSQNADMFVNNTVSHSIGRQDWATSYFDGYMSHVALVDGQQLAPTVFGETDSTSGIWKFKQPSGVTWGTNGFWLKFENSGALGTDSSGNSSTFTVNGNGRQALDTPSNVYATFLPFVPRNVASGDRNPTFSNGNTTASFNNSGYNLNAIGSIALKGKYYWETKWVNANSDASATTGIVDLSSYDNGFIGTQCVGYEDDGTKINEGSATSYGNSYASGDIIGTAFDSTTGTIWFSKNGVWQNSATISEIASGTTTNSAYTGLSTSVDWLPLATNYASRVCNVNFGNGYFGTTAISSAGSNGNGSLFEYDVPSGYYALNTKNINTYG